ncbi:uncharacterized protein E0L32_008640 [Thyridium curvatum]|uniref:Bola-like protein n=1 Tax=Thyridium curvatum TaxID=1093900 RepID=A0A507AZX8_9PEZI|nr:uncharacterized protein E0L32_008640 [Thyridium curvatum]TPX10421.1 hypothetical protein E0L32_008640 [Thyridium curvatum]
MLCRTCLRARVAALQAAAKPSAAHRTLIGARLPKPSSSRAITSRAASLRTTTCSASRATSPSTYTTRRTLASEAAASSSSSSATTSESTSAGLEKPDFLDAAESEIWDRLVKEFSPVELLVQDISGGCGSMYGIEISSDKFKGANMLKQQRMVNAVLGDLMKQWHGIQLKTRVP